MGAKNKNAGLSCDICRRLFACAEALSLHMKNVHKSTKFKTNLTKKMKTTKLKGAKKHSGVKKLKTVDVTMSDDEENQSIKSEKLSADIPESTSNANNTLTVSLQDPKINLEVNPDIPVESLLSVEESNISNKRKKGQGYDSLERLMCTGCKFLPQRQFDYHVSSLHAHEVVSLFFPEFSDFHSWLEDMQTETESRYSKNSISNDRSFFMCDTPPERGILNGIQYKSICPSSIMLQRFREGYQVHYYRVHYGHKAKPFTKLYKYKENAIENFLGHTSKFQSIKDSIYSKVYKILQFLLSEAGCCNAVTLRCLYVKALEMAKLMNKECEALAYVASDVNMTEIADPPKKSNQITGSMIITEETKVPTYLSPKIILSPIKVFTDQEKTINKNVPVNKRSRSASVVLKDINEVKNDIKNQKKDIKNRRGSLAKPEKCDNTANAFSTPKLVSQTLHRANTIADFNVTPISTAPNTNFNNVNGSTHQPKRNIDNISITKVNNDINNTTPVDNAKNKISFEPVDVEIDGDDIKPEITEDLIAWNTNQNVEPVLPIILNTFTTNDQVFSDQESKKLEQQKLTFSDTYADFLKQWHVEPTTTQKKQIIRTKLGQFNPQRIRPKSIDSPDKSPKTTIPEVPKFDVLTTKTNSLPKPKGKQLKPLEISEALKNNVQNVYPSPKSRKTQEILVPVVSLQHITAAEINSSTKSNVELSKVNRASPFSTSSKSSRDSSPKASKSVSSKVAKESPLTKSRTKPAILTAPSPKTKLPNRTESPKISKTTVSSTDKTKSVLPTNKIKPVVPTDNNKPVLPTDKTKPVLPTDKTKPVLPTDKIKPVLSTDKTKSVLSTDKTKPVLSTDKTKPVLSTDKTKPVLSTDKTKPVLAADRSRKLKRAAVIETTPKAKLMKLVKPKSLSSSLVETPKSKEIPIESKNRAVRLDSKGRKSLPSIVSKDTSSPIMVSPPKRVKVDQYEVRESESGYNILVLKI